MTRRRWWACSTWALGLALILLAPLSHAGIPEPYAALVGAAATVDGRQEFDLRPAQQRARKTGKSLYVYLGATDCPYCRKYEAFLAQQSTALVPHFAEKYLVVDLRSALSVTAPQLVIRTDSMRLPYADFQRAIGDQRARIAGLSQRVGDGCQRQAPDADARRHRHLPDRGRATGDPSTGGMSGVAAQPFLSTNDRGPGRRPQGSRRQARHMPLPHRVEQGLELPGVGRHINSGASSRRPARRVRNAASRPGSVANASASDS